MIVSPDGSQLLESTDKKKPNGKNGVRVVDISYLAERDNVEFRLLPQKNPAAFWQAALKYQDYEYDNLYSLGWLLAEPRMEDNKKLSCIELLLVAAEDVNDPLFPPDSGVISIRDVYLITKSKE
jgi:hypothetical protein